MLDAPWLHAAAQALSSVPVHAFAVVLVMALLQRVARRLGLWPYALFALPGTLAHELSHWLVAWVLRARPQGLDLVPRRTATGWQLGSVAFQAPWWRAGPIALAPLLLAPAALGWLLAFTARAEGVWLLVHGWITATLLQACLPSRTDLRIAWPFLALLAAVGLIVALAAPAIGLGAAR